MKTSQLMLYREIIAVYSQIHTKHINAVCGQNVEFVGAIANLRKATISFVMCLSVCPSVRPHGASRLPLDSFSGNLIFEDFFENRLGIFNFD